MIVAGFICSYPTVRRQFVAQASFRQFVYILLIVLELIKLVKEPCNS
jgi:hypothetical protein